MFTLNRKLIVTLLAAAPVFAFVDAATAGDCLEYQVVNVNLDFNSNGPIAAFDSLRAKSVVFTHVQGTPSVTRVKEYNGVSWSNGPEIEGPMWVSNARASATYHPMLGLTLLQTINGVAAWNGLSWSQLPAPFAARFNASMVYDAARNRVVLYGGRIIGANVPTSETWEWDGANWAPGVPGPPARHDHAMAYDSQRGVIVVHGGRSTAAGPDYLGDVWEYDGAVWVERTPMPGSGPQPLPRYRHAMAFDSQRGVTVMYGGVFPGSGSLAETWEWNGNSWRQRVLLNNPNPISGSQLLYDNNAKLMRMFAQGIANDHAVISAPETPLITGQPKNVVAASGAPVQFAVTAVSDFDLRYQWRYNGQPIPNATLSAHTIPAVSTKDVGIYDCVVSIDGFGDFPCGSATSIAATLTMQTCPADISPDGGDGLVNVNDLLRVINGWGACP